MLIKHELPVAKEETERCDTLRYSWEKLNVQGNEMQSHLLEIQPNFKTDLITNVKTFISDCGNFYHEYNKVDSMSICCHVCISKPHPLILFLFSIPSNPPISPPHPCNPAI